MNFRTTTILFGLLMGMLWLFGLILAANKASVDPSFIMSKLQGESGTQIDSVTFSRQPPGKEKKEFTFTRDKNNWVLNSGKHNLRVENSRIEKIINEIKGARKNDEADPTNDPALYELQPPTTVVTLKGKGGAKNEEPVEYKFNIGKENADKSLVFVNTPDFPKRVFGVTRSSIGGLFFDDPNSLRARQLFDFTESAVKAVNLKDGGKSVDMAKSSDNSWRFVKPAFGLVDFEGIPAPKESPADSQSASLSGLKGLLSSISNLRVDSEDDFVPPSESDLNFFGLEPGKETSQIQVVRNADKSDSSKETLLIGNKVSGKEKYYARMDGDEGIFKIAAKQLEPIRKVIAQPGTLRSTDIATFDPNDPHIDLVKLAAGQGEIKLTHPEGKPWMMQAPDESAKKANENAIHSLLTALQGKQAIRSFYDETDKKSDADLGLDHPVAEIAIFQDALVKQEKKDAKDDVKTEATGAPPEIKKDAKPVVTLAFGKSDGALVAVKRTLADGTVNHFAVAQTLLDQVKPAEGKLAFLETGLPALENVVEMTIERGKNKVEIVRGEGDNKGRWYLKDAADPKARSLADIGKVMDVIGNLSGLQAKKWVRKVGAKEDLATEGLKEPVVTVRLRDKKDQIGPAPLAQVAALLAQPCSERFLPVVLTLAQAQINNKGDEVVLKFGGEAVDEKERPAVYAKHSGSDLLFLVRSEIERKLQEIDFRDRTYVITTQGQLDSSLVGLSASGGLSTFLNYSPLVTNLVIDRDPTSVRSLKLTVRTLDELRQFHFVRDDKDKAWRDQSGLKEFNLDSSKVTAFVEKLCTLTPERLVSLAGPKSDQKLTDKEASLVMVMDFDKGPPLTITVGAAFDLGGYFARFSNWPEAIYLLPGSTVQPLQQRGAGFFAKERLALAP